MEIWRIATNRAPQMTWEPLKSMRQDGPSNLRVCPVVTEVRQLAKGEMEFEVFMFQVPGPGAGRSPANVRA